VDYFNYLKSEILNPGWTNYFYWLIALSLFVMLLEIILPWRKNQKILRKGFFLDVFYIIFNFFLFSLVGYNAISNVGVAIFNDFLSLFDIDNIVAIQVSQFPAVIQLLIMFVIADFIQWLVHIQLHKNPYLWEFHKIHHSVKEMSFAAQFRFHFMETVIYKTAQYVPLAMIGFGIQEFFIVHMLGVLVGHLNHANLGWSYGVFGKIINNPKMHIWHHSKELPESHPYGMNFGLTLSLWDYLFGTAYVPKDGKNINLGFEGVDEYQTNFWSQLKRPFQKLKSK
jgi:sterol desaturase/sphingolipid hydroxylase (fatty acid hydroxylase superfamily)